MSKIIAAVALSALLAMPTFALAREGYRAHAQAPNPSGDMSVDSTHMNPARAQALRDCTAMEQKWDQRTWGAQQLDVYRECMARHGQAE